MRKIFLTTILFFPFISSFSQIWKPLGAGLTPNEVDDVYLFNGDLYASGSFIYSGSDTVNSIARWDGQSWNPLGAGSTWGGLLTMCKFNNDLYAGGSFQYMDGIPLTKKIARWDGNNWNSLNSGITSGGEVSAMAVYNGELYTGGEFQKVDNMTIRNIAKWDGSSWHACGIMSGGLSQVLCMSVFNNELYIGGYFDRMDGDTMYNIAKFDGTNWSSVGQLGLNSFVMALYPDTVNNRLYAAGTFFYADSVYCPSNVAYWDGSAWHPVGTNGPNLIATSLCIYKSQLYVGSCLQFPPVNQSGDTLRFISRWDGNDWQPLGYGVNDCVQALGVYNDDLIVGGAFSRAGDSIAYDIAAYTDTTSATGLIESHSTKGEIKIIPNPFNSTATVQLPISYQNYFPCTFKLFDTTGKEVMQVKNVESLNFTISKNNLKRGVYYYKLSGKKAELDSGKLVIE